jgi:hypothetical protein
VDHFLAEYPSASRDLALAVSDEIGPALSNESYFFKVLTRCRGRLDAAALSELDMDRLGRSAAHP